MYTYPPGRASWCARTSLTPLCNVLRVRQVLKVTQCFDVSKLSDMKCVFSHKLAFSMIKKEY